MNLFKALLFHHGYIGDMALAQRLAAASDAEQADALRRAQLQRQRHLRKLARQHARLIRKMTALSPFR